MGRSTTQYQGTQERLLVPVVIGLILVVALGLLTLAIAPEISKTLSGFSAQLKH